MASGTLGDSDEDLNTRGRCRWTENSKVYTRRIRKNNRITCKIPDTATNPTFISDNPTSAVPTTPKQTDVSSATVAAEQSSISTFENTNFCSAASTVPTTNDSLEEITNPQRIGGDQAVEEQQIATNTGDVILDERSRHRETSLSPGPPDKDGDTSHHQHHEQLILLSDGDHIQNRLLEESGSRSAELQNVEDLPLAPSTEAQKLRIASPAKIELLEMGEDMSEGLRGKPPLSSEIGLLNGREVDRSHLPVGTEAQNDGEQMPGLFQVPQGNFHADANEIFRPLVVSRVEDRIRFNLCKATSKDDIMDLRKKLECELDQVRGLAKQVELRQPQLASQYAQISNSILSNNSNYIGHEGADIGLYSHPQPQNTLVKMTSELSMMGHQDNRPNGLMRVNSDMGTVRNLEPRPYSRQLSVAVMENNHQSSEFMEKEKRTPKANQYYRNSEFLLGKDRLPPENNKRLKTSNRRRGNGETEHAFGFIFDKSRNKVFRSCSNILQRLMKHKYGWVFNEPVDAKALGLFDYHDIIKHPMDLGTIKTKLSQNWYKSPREFAEDVRLVFRNAMTYNPKGQDVHVMAEQLLHIFDDRWAVIELDYNHYSNYQTYSDGGFLTPTSRKATSLSDFGPPVAPHGFVPTPVHDATPTPASMLFPAAPQVKISDRHEPMVMAVDPKIQRPYVGRTPAPKKPKAKDPDKRDMTYDEKQRLSNHLQGLPHEKLDAIVQIIKKRNTALSQHDDEIEVDIDSVDPETLWELDRFVTNYKKSLSKNKRKAELALQSRMTINSSTGSKNSNPALENSQMEGGAAFQKSSAPLEGEGQGYDRSRSSSSSSSSSDSGSSSSDSDSDSSSADGSDAGNSPGTSKM